MKTVATLILLGFVSAILCGFTLSSHPLSHGASHQHHDVNITHHVAMYDDLSEGILSDSGMLFVSLLSLLSIAVVAFFLAVPPPALSPVRLFSFAQSPHTSPEHLRRWLSRFEHSPSFA